MNKQELQQWIKDNNPYPRPIMSGDPYHGTESSGFYEWERGVLDLAEHLGINKEVFPTNEQFCAIKELQNRFEAYEFNTQHFGGDKMEEYEYVKSHWNDDKEVMLVKGIKEKLDLPTQDEYEHFKHLQVEYAKYAFFCKQFNVEKMDEFDFIVKEWNEDLNTPDIGTPNAE